MSPRPVTVKPLDEPPVVGHVHAGVHVMRAYVCGGVGVHACVYMCVCV